MLLLIDKPTGMTSYDVIRRMKKKFPGQKIGHSGTLDPLATGLLIVGIGKDTKRLGTIQGLDKSYQARMTFARTTDTWDVDAWEKDISYEVTQKNGKFCIQKDDDLVFAPDILVLEKSLLSLVGNPSLPLPPFSAKKKSGKKLYELARKGDTVMMQKEMTIINVSLDSYAFPFLEFTTTVGSGTYIRSMAYWLGEQFGMGGILTGLRRISIGKYTVEDAWQLDDLLDASGDRLHSSTI